LPELQYLGFAGNDAEEPCDELHMDGDVIVYVGPSALGEKLEATYGPLPWLHWPEPFGGAPPAPDAFGGPE
jgi:hypothetical protein